MKTVLLGLLSLWGIAMVQANDETLLQFHSAEVKTQVIELFTSEGCSSCPPADRWVSRYVDHPDLFNSVIPLAFHVDYWNWLGWADPFSQAAYTQRQRDYARTDRLSQVYTPGIIVNSYEWIDWFNGSRTLPIDATETGILRVAIDSAGAVTGHFTSDEPLEFHVAVLGMGLKNTIGNGENRGKTLTHDFVVLDWHQVPGSPPWQTALPDLSTLPLGEKPAVVFWVSKPGDVGIIQATGGYVTHEAVHRWSNAQ